MLRIIGRDLMKKRDITGNREIKFITHWKILDLTLGCNLGVDQKKIAIVQTKILPHLVSWSEKVETNADAYNETLKWIKENK